MSLQHFFLEKQNLEQQLADSDDELISLDLSDEDYHHIKVLRIKQGEHIAVIDAGGVYYECEICDIENSVLVRICQSNCEVNASNQFYLSLFVGLTKSNKLDSVFKSCTEIGIDEFVPVSFNRSVVKLDQKKQQSKIERWEKIVKSAAMQSGQLRIPKISEFMCSKNFDTMFSEYDYVLVFWEESSDISLLNDVCSKIKNLKDSCKIAIVIGPEGGIEKSEIESIAKNNAIVCDVSFGRSILRAETACISACSIVKYLLEC